MSFECGRVCTCGKMYLNEACRVGIYDPALGHGQYKWISNLIHTRSNI